MYLIIYLEFVASNTWQKANLYTFMFCMCQQYSLTSHHNYLCVTSSILGAGFDLFHTIHFKVFVITAWGYQLTEMFCSCLRYVQNSGSEH